jgi:hypothetical protein
MSVVHGPLFVEWYNGLLATFYEQGQRNKKRLLSGTGAGSPIVEKSRYLVSLSSSTIANRHLIPG